MVGGFVTTGFVVRVFAIDGTTGDTVHPVLPPPPPPPPPPPDDPPELPPLLFVTAENVAKVVKCFVQMMRSEPTVIIHSPSTGSASQVD